MRLRLPRLASFLQDLPPAYWFLWLGTVINRLGGFVVPFLTLYLTSERGISVGVAALTVALFGAGSFVAQLVGGELTDRLGRRPVMLISFLFAPIAMLALGFSRGLSSIMALTCLLGFFTDLYRPAVSAAITDIVQPAARPRAFGYLYWAINLGAALAPILAGLMARYDYLLLFIGDAVTTFAFAVIILLRVPETQPMEVVPAARISVFARVGNLKREPILLVFTLLALFFGMIYTQGHVTLPLDMQRRGLSPADYGLATAVNGALIVLVTLKLSRAAERWPRFTSMAISALLVGAGFGLTGLSRTLPAYAFTVIVWTFGEIIAASVAPTIIGDLAPVELRGLYQGIFGSAWGLSFFVGPLLGGLVYERFGPGSLWFACFALGVAVCLGYLALARPANHRLAQEPTAAAGLAPSP